MLYGAASFSEGRFENRRTLQSRTHLDKYTTGWECSRCGRNFELNRTERQAAAMYGEQIPGRIRCEFEKHTCTKAPTLGEV